MNLIAKVKNRLKRKKSADNKPATAVVAGGNNKRFKLPPLRSRRGVLFVVLFALITAAVLYSVFAGTQSDLDAQDQITRLNSYRTAQGVGTLATSSCLTQSAREWSEHMAGYGDLHHSTDKKHPEDTGFEALVAKYCGVPAAGQPGWTVIAENLGVGGTSQELFEALQQSPRHNQNMLDVRFNVVGVGAYRDDSGKLWITQHFAKCDNCSANWYATPPAVVADTSGVKPNGVATAMKPDRAGHWVVEANGRVVNYYTAKHYGDIRTLGINLPPDKQIIGIVSSVTGNGYWLVASDGGTFSFGDAKFWGSTGGRKLNKPVVTMAPTPTGNGYWLTASDGGVFAFGDAKFLGSMGNKKLNKPIVTMAATPTGNGYWLVATDGGVFAFGDAVFYGSTGNIPLSDAQRIIAMTPTITGKGYWLIGKDGGVFSFGDAVFYGSTGNLQLPLPVVGFIVNTDGLGYYVIKSDGTGFGFGSARPVLGVVIERTPPPSTDIIPPYPVYEVFVGQTVYSAQNTQHTFTWYRTLDVAYKGGEVSGVDRYEIFRKLNDGPVSLLATIPEIPGPRDDYTPNTLHKYTDTTLPLSPDPAQIYTYYVDAIDKAGNRAPPLSGYEFVLSTGPTTPGKLSSGGNDCNITDGCKARFGWAPSYAPGGISGYNIYRQDTGKSRIKVASVPPNTTVPYWAWVPSYEDSSMPYPAVDSSYDSTYTVTAYDAAGRESTESKPYSFTFTYNPDGPGCGGCNDGS